MADKYYKQKRDWYLRNKDKYKKYHREWYLRHKSEQAQRTKAWRLVNKERQGEYKRRYQEKHPDRVRASAKKSREIHGTEYTHRRKARLRNNGGSFTPTEWKNLCEKYGYVCLCCGEKKPLTIDHVIPLSVGGTNYISNIQPLCERCNKSKGVKVIDYRGTSKS